MLRLYHSRYSLMTIDSHANFVTKVQVDHRKLSAALLTINKLFEKRFLIAESINQEFIC